MDKTGSDKPHKHPLRADQDDTLTYWRALEESVRALLIEKSIITADEVRSGVEDMDNRTPLQGAKVVVRAWRDPEFRKRLLCDGNSTIAEIGIDRGPYKLVVVENTEKIHNLVVCTLCSCYPRWLLGLPPDWYKSRNYRSRAVNEPRKVLSEFGLVLPENVTVRVHDSTADMRYLVLPKQPEGVDQLNDDQLIGLVSRDTMIGVALPRLSDAH